MPQAYNNRGETWSEKGKLEGFSAKTEESILEEIECRSWGKSRTKRVVAETIAGAYVDYQQQDKSVKDIAVAGSYRRGQETVGDRDPPDDILRKLDVVVGAFHSEFTLSRQKQTERVLRTMDHPFFNILAHPTGRRISEREANGIDPERPLKKTTQLARRMICQWRMSE